VPLTERREAALRRASARSEFTLRSGRTKSCFDPKLLIGAGLLALTVALVATSRSTTARPRRCVRFSRGRRNAGPCQKYAAALCEKAGKESDTCTALTNQRGHLVSRSMQRRADDMAYSIKKLGEARQVLRRARREAVRRGRSTSETCNMVKAQTKQFPPARLQINARSPARDRR